LWHVTDDKVTQGDDTGVEARMVSVDDQLPMTLARLHWGMRVGSTLSVEVERGDYEREWLDRLRDVVIGAGLAVDEVVVEGRSIRVRACRLRSLPDTVGPGMRLLVCGLNPSLYAADAGVGYARPGNRFWPAARSAGLVERDRDPVDALVHHGMGMTDLVKRPTTGARGLTAGEYRAGAARVERLVRWLHPAAVCFVGMAGWRAAVDPRAAAGEQADGFGGVPAYVMPSTSGANAHSRLDDLADHLRAAVALSR
jgi:TDG/mug DNA glycosylase family protein